MDSNDTQSGGGILILLLILSIIVLVIIVRLRRKLKKQEQKSALLFKDLSIAESQLNTFRTENNNLKNELTFANKQLDNFRLERLKFQLNPHTIINSIGSLTNYANKTVEGLSGLNTIMSFMLHEGSEQFITLRQELSFLYAYIQINSLKLSPLVDKRIDCFIKDDDAIMDRKFIPPFLTAYFIENAFKHGDTTQDGIFYISINKHGDNLIYTVKNKISSSNSPTEKSNGIGK